MAQQQDISYFSGNDISFAGRFTDEATGDPLDLSGAQMLTYAVSRSATARTPLIEKQLGDGVTVVSPTGGLAQIVLGSSDTEPLSGTYYHEVRLVNAQGRKMTLLYGKVTVLPNLIRS